MMATKNYRMFTARELEARILLGEPGAINELIARFGSSGFIPRPEYSQIVSELNYEVDKLKERISELEEELAELRGSEA